MKKRNIYSKEFKLEVLRQWKQEGQSATVLARSLGLRPNMLYKWEEQFIRHGDQAFRGSGKHSVVSVDELSRLKKELSDVKMERDILKKAAAYFARELK